MNKEERKLAEAIAERIKTKRGCSHCGDGLTLGETQKHTGINPNTYLTYEKGRNLPGLANFIKICKWLGASPNEILGWKE